MKERERERERKEKENIILSEICTMSNKGRSFFPQVSVSCPNVTNNTKRVDKKFKLLMSVSESVMHPGKHSAVLDQRLRCIELQQAARR